jgi:hypothetical protein
MEAHPMTELAAVAASVAKALGLGETYKISKSEGGEPVAWWADETDTRGMTGRIYLEADGSNLFAPYWQVRCRDWLLERGAVYHEGGHDGAKECFVPYTKDEDDWPEVVQIKCPAAEFCTRAIHELTKEKA